MSAQKLRRKHVEGSRAILEILEIQQIEFQDIMTGDESWISLDTNPNSL
jgi:hypothetical protein